MFTKKFGFSALERAIKTMAQTIILIFGANQINVVTIDWLTVAGLAGGGFVLSILTSIISLPIGDKDSPSLLTTIVETKNETPATK